MCGGADTVGMGGSAGVVWVTFGAIDTLEGSEGVLVDVPGSEEWSELEARWHTGVVLLPGLGILCPANLFPRTMRAFPTSFCVPGTFMARVVVLPVGRTMVM